MAPSPGKPGWMGCSAPCRPSAVGAGIACCPKYPQPRRTEGSRLGAGVLNVQRGNGGQDGPVGWVPGVLVWMAPSSGIACRPGAGSGHAPRLLLERTSTRSSLDRGQSACPWARGVGAPGCPRGLAGGQEGSTEEVTGEIYTNTAGKGCRSRRADGPWAGGCSQGA